MLESLRRAHRRSPPVMWIRRRRTTPVSLLREIWVTQILKLHPDPEATPRRSTTDAQRLRPRRCAPETLVRRFPQNKGNKTFGTRSSLFYTAIRIHFIYCPSHLRCSACPKSLKVKEKQSNGTHSYWENRLKPVEGGCPFSHKEYNIDDRVNDSILKSFCLNFPVILG